MKTFLSVILLCFSVAVHAQDYSALIKKADKLYESKNYTQSQRLYAQALSIKADNPNHLYNAACTAALAGNTKQAVSWLELAVDKGWLNIEHLKTDADLTSLHSDKEWPRIVEKLQKNVDKAEANFDKPLKKELETIFDTDQEIRHKYIAARKEYGFEHRIVDSLGREMNKVDSINHIKIVKILDTKGWVGSDVVGSKANQAIFLVVQHSHLDTQKKYLPMMHDAVKNGKASASALALLEDRIAIRENRRQIYGSQIGTNRETKEYYVLPLEDPDNVDKRRAAVGLGPLAEYITTWDLKWDTEEYKKNLPVYEELARKKE